MSSYLIIPSPLLLLKQYEFKAELLNSQFSMEYLGGKSTLLLFLNQMYLRPQCLGLHILKSKSAREKLMFHLATPWRQGSAL
jgi:hypothetical protein